MNHLKMTKAEQKRQFNLAYSLAFGSNSKNKNWKRIFAIWQSVASTGHMRSQFYLATCYDHGKGVKKDITQAYKWFLKAARQGHMESQYNISFFYRDGEVVKKNLKKAFHWISLSANQGDIEAIRDLGYAYFYGYGVKYNLEVAAWLYKKAARKNDSKAFFNLGLCYKHGEGVQQSNRWAIHNFNKAIELGHQRAAKQIEEIAKKLKHSVVKLYILIINARLAKEFIVGKVKL